jgi:glycosyltransferase involved in cell wall biosynthesis
VRFVAYDDQVFERDGEELWTERTFPVFVAAVGEDLDGLVVVGRERRGGSARNFRLPDGLEFVALPYYESLTSLRSLSGGVLGSLRTFWRRLDDVDGAWVLGPHPLGLAFALLTLARRRRLVLGVRQEMRSYVRSRHPGRGHIHLAGDLLEYAWRGLGRVSAVVVVGPELRRQYRHARRLHEMRVSLMRTADLVGPETERARAYVSEQLRMLSVGRLDEEKNPLLLADIVARLRADGRDWRLVVCGTGSLADALAERVEALGLGDAVELRGYVPLGAGLQQLYRESHLFLHVSWTEGVPQVLFEAFAARLPIVATAVGGVPETVGEDAALLVPPGDAEAAATAAARIAADPDLRERLTEAGARRVAAHTLEAEAAATAAFLSA